MSRLPVRVRLAGAFALAMLLVLSAAAAFSYVRLRADLNESLDTSLASRADDIAALTRGPESGFGDGDRIVEADETFGQILTPAGAVVDTAGGAREPALSPGEARRATRGTVRLERRVDGIEGTARILARPASAGLDPAVAVAGASLEDRDETLSTLLASFLVGGPVAVLLASGIGYLLAAAGLRPVEAMRRRASEVSLSAPGERLPLPAARDEVHRLGTTLNEMLVRLEASFERERRFVADASHEMRTPLAVLRTELETALRSAGGDPGLRAALAAAVEEADQLGALAEDLLVLARAADGRLPVRPEPLDVRELLDATRERFSDRAGERGRRVVVDAPGDLRANADPLRLRQALGNLVDNALRHGAGEITLSARAAGRGVAIGVRDEGDGFPPGLAGREFERFSRGDETRARGGSGLGLAIVRAVAEAHGGAAEAIPPPGPGVRLTIPAV